MPDIELRFDRDVLVLSAPLDAQLASQGLDAQRDLGYLLLMEPDAVVGALRLELSAGAQCLVLPTRGITTAQLAHARMEDDAARLAHEACAIAAKFSPQHVIAEIGPCGLPIDPASKASLNENRAQYAGAARAFADEQVDAILLSGFGSLVDLKCALMGVGQVTGRPVFASVQVEGSGTLPDGMEFADAVDVMADLGAAVVGFETAEPLANAAAFARLAAAKTDLPLLAQLHVRRKDSKQGGPTAENPYYCADAMEQAAVQLIGAGVQFLRAAGNATAAYTGALVATSFGVDVAARRR